MAAPAPIARGDSSPTIPNAPSLLKLPTDIRLCIYDLLFNETEILVHNAAAYLPPLIHAPDHRRQVFRELVSESDRTFKRRVGKNNDLKYDFSKAFPLLRSCRQIYHECVDIFYSKKSFVLTRVGVGCDIQLDYSGIMESSGQYCQTVYAGPWLQSLGSLRESLTSVIIDVDTLCPSQCWDPIKNFDLLPLLHLLWRRPGSVKFKSMGRELSHHVYSRYSPADDGRREVMASTLNTILTALAKSDPLQLKPHAWFVLHVVVFRNFRTGYVSFSARDKRLGSSYLPGYWNLADTLEVHLDNGLRYFSISNHGSQMQWAARSRPSPRGLPMEIITRIFCYAQRQPASIVLDTKKKLVSGFSPFPFHLNTYLRYHRHFGDTLYAGIPVSLIVMPNDVSTDLPGLEWLEALRKSCYCYAFGGSLNQLAINAARFRRPVGPSVQLNIGVHLQRTEPLLLTEIRIDMKHLLPLLGIRRLVSDPSIEMHLAVTTASGGTYVECQRVRFTRLRQELFLLLSDMLDHWKRNEAIAESDEEFLQIPVPTVTLNGRLELLHVTCAQSASLSAMTLTNTYRNISPDELLHRGYRAAERFHGMFHTHLEHGAVGLWIDLHEKDWDNWEQVRPGMKSEEEESEEEE